MDIDFNEPKWQDFIEYIVRRARVYQQKHVLGVEPDLPNVAFREYFLCNVWRELDRFSKEEIFRLREIEIEHAVFDTDPLNDQVALILLARHSISWDTYDFLTKTHPEPTLMDVYAFWEDCKESDKTFVSNAIQMYPKPGSDRAKTVLAHYHQVKEKSDEIAEAIRGGMSPAYIMAKVLHEFDHIGAFKAYEIFTSFTYMTNMTLTEEDQYLVGPGAIKNLEWLTGIDNLKPHTAPAVLSDTAMELRSYLITQRPDMWWITPELQGQDTHTEQHKFTARTLEDCLCEFRKHNNYVNGEGRRRRYEGNK